MKPDLRVLFPVFLPGTGVWTGRQGGLGLSRPQRWASRRKRTSSPFSPLQGRAVRMWQGARLSHRPRIAGQQEQDHHSPPWDTRISGRAGRVWQSYSDVNNYLAGMEHIANEVTECDGRVWQPWAPLGNPHHQAAGLFL